MPWKGPQGVFLEECLPLPRPPQCDGGISQQMRKVGKEVDLNEARARGGRLFKWGIANRV